MPKRYNTPHRSRVVKTRLSEDEYADFTARLAPQKRFPSGEKFFSLSPRKWLTDKSIFCDK